MIQLIIISIMLISILIPDAASEVMAQSLTEGHKLIPSMLRVENQMSQSLPSAGTFIPKMTAVSHPQTADFDFHFGSAAAGHTVSFPGVSRKISLENLTTLIAGAKDLLSPGHAGLKINSGVSYFFPVHSHVAAFASFKPSLPQMFTAPHTMVGGGIHIPLAHGGPGSHDMSLKFSASLDRNFQPVFSFTFNLTPFAGLLKK